MKKPKRVKHGMLKREVDHGPSERPLLEYDLSRKGLYDSMPAIKQRDWDKVFNMTNPSSPGTLRQLHQEALPDLGTNKPGLPFLDRFEGQPGPMMICEFGFGDTTYRLLEWCMNYDAYLVTVDMPIAPQETRDSEKYNELYWWGVDRYHKKYAHCKALLTHPIAVKRWLWINDDIYQVAWRIVQDRWYREKLFFQGKIDYFYEDAIHDGDFHRELFKQVKPFMRKGGVFTGDDNAPTHIIK